MKTIEFETEDTAAKKKETDTITMQTTKFR